MKLLVSAATGVVLFGSVISSAFAAGPLQNGSFENGTAPGTFLKLTAPDTSTINNWNVGTGSIDYIGSYWSSSDGTRSLDMNGTTNGAITQSFPTLVGHTYVVTFDMSGNPDGLPALKTLNVDTGGAPTGFSYDTSATGNTDSNMKWAHKSFMFSATGTTTTLTFTSTTDVNSSFGPALDNVNVGANPASFEDCDSFQNFVNGNGQTFTNEGFCIAYVAKHLHNTTGNIGYSAYSLTRHAQWGIANDGSSAFGAVGSFLYTDANHDWYVVNAKDLHVSGNTAWFAGKVTSASQPSWVGNWLFAKFVDNSPDMIWGSFTTMSAAETGVAAMTNPVDGPFNVITGNLTVH